MTCVSYTLRFIHIAYIYMSACIFQYSRIQYKFLFVSLWSLCVFLFFFFFSSRRRHTRYWRDWSSDVCSSDLGSTAAQCGSELHGLRRQTHWHMSPTSAAGGPWANCLTSLSLFHTCQTGR